MNKKIWWYLGGFVALVAVFYFLLFAGTDYYKVKLPVVNYVKEFKFTDQDGEQITERNVEGKVYVAEYFFTTCKGICPKMNANMKTIFEKYKTVDNFAIVSHTCMPEIDSVPLLKNYQAKMMSADEIKNYPDKWFFVTGNKDSLYRMARESYLLDNDKNNSQNIADQFIHTQFFALIDKQRRVRGIYDGLKKDELEKLSIDIGELLKETKDNHSGIVSPFSNAPA
ncbi:MAG: SCO family protein [Ginsengibacter sp.]